MDLLVDTQTLVWIAEGSPRLRPRAAQAIRDGSNALFVSAVVAFEYADLNKRSRFGADLPLGPLLAKLKAEVIAFPSEAWQLAEVLPGLHRDPVDRMLVAHAIHADLTLVTADATIRRYPVRTLW